MSVRTTCAEYRDSFAKYSRGTSCFSKTFQSCNHFPHTREKVIAFFPRCIVQDAVVKFQSLRESFRIMRVTFDDLVVVHRRRNGGLFAFEAVVGV